MAATAGFVDTGEELPAALDVDEDADELPEPPLPHPARLRTANKLMQAAAPAKRIPLCATAVLMPLRPRRSLTRTVKKSPSTSASGSRRTPIGVGRWVRHNGARILPAVVVTETVKGATLPFVIDTAAGILHVAACGTPLHCNCTAPENPAAGMICRLYCAVAPATTATTLTPGDPPPPLVDIVYGVAVPVSEMVCGDPGAL